MKKAAALHHFVIFIFAFTILNALSVFAGPSRTTYQAKIIKPDGYPLEATSVNFKFTILDPAGSCILYSETFSTVNMGSSAGLVSFSLGTGVRTFPVVGSTFEQVFSNTTASLTCDAGGPATYSPSANDTRKIVMQFNDGNGWQTLPAMTINAVPYAMYANDSLKFGGKDITEFVQVASLPTCGASEAMRFNGVGFSCIVAGGSGTITSGSVITALGYTPADGASITTVTANLNSVSSTVASVSSTVYSVASSVASLQNSVAASFTAITSSQWTSSGTAISYDSGFVGVGTSAPTGRLHVVGTGGGNLFKIEDQVNGPSGAYLELIHSRGGASLANNDFTGGIYFRGMNSGGLQTIDVANIFSQMTNVASGSESGNLAFYTRNNGARTEKMRIDASGNIGVGTTTPVTKLDVSGAIRIGMESASCAASYAGAIRYNAGAVEFCNGTTWAAIDTGSVTSAAVTSALGYTPMASGTASYLVADGGSTASPTVRFAPDASTGFYRFGTNSIGVSVNNNFLARFDSAGLQVQGNISAGNQCSYKICIGMWSAPGNPTPALTDLGQVIGINRNGPGTTVLGNGLYVTAGGAPTGASNMVGGDLILGSGVATGNATSNIELRTASAGASGTVDSVPTVKMKILGDGNVGIGTASPAAKLDVSGTIKISGGSPGSGKVLTSDASGLASWQTPAPILPADSSVLYKVRAATTANITLSATQTIDGIALSVGDRVLVKNQTTASQNGVYVVSGGAWSRATDFDSWSESNNYEANVSEGGSWGGTKFVAKTPFTGTLDTTSIYFSPVGSSADLTKSTAMGAYALSDLTTGQNSTAIGNYALRNNTTGSRNTAVGAMALEGNTTANENTAVGVEALRSSNGTGNTAVGYNSLYGNSGTYNIGIGYYALRYPSGSNNVGLGRNVMSNSPSGSDNIGMGNQALKDVTSGYGNIAIGSSALTVTTTGYQNTALSPSALQSNTTGNRNVAVGTNALLNNTTGSNNTALGYNAGSAITTGSNNVVIGANTGSTIATSSNNILISDGAGNIRLQADSTGLVTVSGTLKITGGTPGAGKVLTSDADGDATWATATGDNLGNHTATQNLNLGTYKLVGQGGSEGITIDSTGNIRLGSVGGSTQITAGPGSTASGSSWASIAAGFNAQASSITTFAFGSYAKATNWYAFATGNNTTAGGRASAVFGQNMTVNSDYSVGFGLSSSVSYTVNTPSTMAIMGGKVGIGTTTPSVILTVDDSVGTVSSPYIASTDKLVVMSSGNGVIQMTTPASNTGAIYFSDPQSRDPGGVAYSHLTDSLIFRANQGNRMTIASGGAVGIGTTSPSSYQHGGTNQTAEIYNSGTAANSQAHIVLSSGNSTNADSSIGTITFAQPNMSDANKGLALMSGTTDTDYTTSAPTSRLNFWTRGAAETNWSTKMVIKGNGNVGIGTTNPGAKLDVAGDGYALFGPNSGWGATLRVGGNGGTATAQASIATTNGNLHLDALDNSHNTYMNWYRGGDFSVGKGDSSTALFVVKNSGNVGVGTAGPTALLHVNGAALATAWNTSSDKRLKENIKPIENPVDKILQLRGVEFDWRKDVSTPTKHDETHDIGVIAQEVEKVFPEAVTTPTTGYKSVAYSKLVAPLIEAVKSLYHRLIGLEAQQAEQVRAMASKAEQQALDMANAKIQKLESENAAKDKEIQDMKLRLEKIEKALNSK